MNVLVDTSVWSLVLRRAPERLSEEQKRLTGMVADLVADDRVVIPGLVRQEILSGITDAGRFEKVRAALRSLDDEPVTTADHEAAAGAYNSCRKAGISATAVDVLLCAVAIRLGVPILTTDRDFEQYARVLPIKLLSADSIHFSKPE